MLVAERAPVPDGLRRLARVARNNRHDPEAQVAYGRALFEAGHGPEGLEWIERAADLRPTNAGHLIDLGSAYCHLGRYDAALSATERAYRLDPTRALAAFNLSAIHHRLHDAAPMVHWSRVARDLDPSLFDAWGNLIFGLDLLPGCTGGMALEARRGVAERWEAPLRRSWMRHANEPDPDRPIRLGFTGGDWRGHSATFAFGPIVAALDRDRFELYAYADLSSASDDLTDWYRDNLDGWRDVTGCDDATIAAAVRRDGIDVLIDLAGYSKNSHIRTHMHKPAPVQITAWGYLTGTGLRAMDAIVADDVMIPAEHEDQYTERVVRVPYGLGFSDLGVNVPLAIRPSDRPLTFGYLGRPIKVSDETITLWADLLRAHPESRLLLKDPILDVERVRARVLGQFTAAGVAPDRIETRGFSSRPEHMAAYGEIDLALDTLPQGGGMTSLESLYMGCPVVTMLGDRIIGRGSASALHQIGRDEWVARSRDEYVRIAGQIAGKGGPELRDRFLRSAICDDDGRTRAFEAVVRALWADWCARPNGRM